MFWHGLTRSRPNQDDLATDAPYQFQPLSASATIRLIKVHPQKVKGHIACRILHFDENQQQAIRYHSLSYVWGEAESTRQIYLKGQGNEWRPFPLHENLWQFLDHTWRSKRFEQLFWTDYLCLNQKGPEEISQQVPRMHAIYRNAELVVIWLQLNEYDQEGLRELVTWDGLRKLMPKVLHRVIQEHEHKRLRKVVRWGGLPNFMPKILRRVIQERLFMYQKAIRGAMDNPYWRRIWIVQEVVVAKKVCVTTGDISIALDELRILADSLVDASSWAQEPSMGLLCDMRAVGGKIPLWRILRDFKSYQSSRPVDRVFGMLGMVEDHEDGSSPVENIQVDYDKEMWQVLLDAIFESSPPLAEYKTTIQCLEPQHFWEGFSLLKHYIRNSKTTTRHRQWARLALHAFEVFSVIKRVRSAPRSGILSDLMDDLFSSAAETDWKPTLRQSVALVGLLLSSWDHGSQFEWERHHASPWRCAAHGSHHGSHTGLGSYERVADVLTSHWDRGSIVYVCGQQSERCNGSIMACEISDIGLRLQVEPGISRADASHLSLYCLKVET